MLGPLNVKVSQSDFRCVRIQTKRALIGVVMSVCPHLSVRLPPDDSRTIWWWALLRQSAGQLQMC